MNPTTKTDTSRSPERESTRERILGVAAWLTGGLLRPEAVAGAMREWKVSRRTAQVYVQKAANRIARMTEYDDPLFAMKLSQLQRDKLLQQLQTLQTESVQMEPHEVRSYLQTIQMQLRLLDSRDRTAAKIAQLEAKMGRAETRQRALQAVQTDPPADAGRLVEAGRGADTARPETMRAAAQVTPRPNHAKQQKLNRAKNMQPATGAPRPPAQGPETCALETSAVGNKSDGAAAAA